MPAARSKILESRAASEPLAMALDGSFWRHDRVRQSGSLSTMNH
jgi:hypothetical protein